MFTVYLYEGPDHTLYVERRDFSSVLRARAFAVAKLAQGYDVVMKATV